MEQFSSVGAGLAAIAFWGFIGMCVIGGIWDSIKKRGTKHETLRRLVESGQPLNDELLSQLELSTNQTAERFDRGLIITALWLLPVSAGLAVFAYVLGFINDKAEVAVFGVSGLLAVMAIGCIIGGKAIAHWYEDEDKSLGSRSRR